ncbi:hypothetical protein SAMN02787081_03972 [Lysinibacillus fusiformis]|uniref:Transmembrane protein n=1 Tax=Lysinibacillus fusiformis TaxID=28031 RepID=A0A1H9R145_9BACI|nr:hypothetical protein SAMN02787081_03972 [Lysinibacillus fusiformis]SEO31045.1 hypothetical protein SAMN02787103_04057 [Lysinibacillus fusiformis]SER66225.1 hypothetical protein SAMN02787113_04292 [Lysinibacillus fusiformis]
MSLNSNLCTCPGQLDRKWTIWLERNLIVLKRKIFIGIMIQIRKRNMPSVTNFMIILVYVEKKQDRILAQAQRLKKHSPSPTLDNQRFYKKITISITYDLGCYPDVFNFLMCIIKRVCFYNGFYTYLTKCILTEALFGVLVVFFKKGTQINDNKNSLDRNYFIK